MPDDLRDHVGWLRDRATRLVALALRAREGGDGELSEQFAAAALACEEEATALNSALRSQKSYKNRRRACARYGRLQPLPP